MKDYAALQKLLELEIEDQEKFWIVYDWLKRELFVLLKEEINRIDWERDWLKQFEEIHSRIIQEWDQIKLIISNFNSKRLSGVLYEVLFYLSCLSTVSVYKGSWIMEITGEIPHQEKPPWFEVLPIYDILPKIFEIKQNGKSSLKAPQIEADFIILYRDDKEVLPLAFVDVKSNLKNYDAKKAIAYALGCKYFCNSILEIVSPKEVYPRELKDWEVMQVCWKCGTLNENAIYCQECKTKIWLAADEIWNNYPLEK